MAKTLTIGMATYDDYDGVYFTAQSIRLYHPEVTADTQVVVIDNHPDGPCAAELKSLEDWIEGYRYIPWNRTAGTSVRDLVFREAQSDFVLCVDSHVLFVPGALARFRDYLLANPDTSDLLQGPLLYDDLRTTSTHMEPRWSCGMYGVWGNDKRAADPDAPPFEIPMQGLGVFGCRRSAWPGFNPRLKGFGCEEGYIQEKIRRAGGKTLCLPFLRWVHRFGRPMGARYENTWEDRIRNYMIVAHELGGDGSDVVDHFREQLGVEAITGIMAAVSEELRNPFSFFDAIYCIEQKPCDPNVFAKAGIAAVIRKVPAANTYAGIALAHRSIIQEAARLGLTNILVFEDNVILTADVLPHLQAALQELKRRDWDLCYLGACRWGQRFPLAEACTSLEQAGAVTSLHAIAYNQPIYQRILDKVPADPAAMEEWIGIHHGLDQYFAANISDRKFLISPSVATSESLLQFESEDFRKRLC